MRRVLLFAVLCLVLLAQHRGFVHPIEHLAAPSPQTQIAMPHADTSCLECSLLASGFTALTASLSLLPASAAVDRLVFHSYHSRAGEVPAWFQSRAPPALL